MRGRKRIALLLVAAAVWAAGLVAETTWTRSVDPLNPLGVPAVYADSDWWG